jgi:hypothetical protein
MGDEHTEKNKNMKKEDCIFYNDKTGCIIFKNCKDAKIQKCDYFHNKKTGYPDYFINHISAINAINQARAAVKQRKFNWYISVIATLTLIIAIISLLLSLRII